MIESTAIIEDDVQIGHGCYIGHYTIIRGVTIIADHSEIRALCFVAGNASIGPNVKIFQYCNIGFGSRIEADVYMGVGVILTNTWRIAHRRSYPTEIRPVIVKRAARIGSGAVILPGVTIGENALIGAGAIITKDIPPETVVRSNPSRLIARVAEEEII